MTSGRGVSSGYRPRLRPHARARTAPNRTETEAEAEAEAEAVAVALPAFFGGRAGKQKGWARGLAGEAKAGAIFGRKGGARGPRWRRQRQSEAQAWVTSFCVKAFFSSYSHPFSFFTPLPF